MEKKVNYQEFFVEGMHCAACELLIEKRLSKVQGIRKVDAQLKNSKVIIESDINFDPKELSKSVEKDGYRIVEILDKKLKINFGELRMAFAISTIIFSIFILIQKLNVVNLLNAEQVTLPFVFFIGVVASISTCMAVVGGLVLSISSNYAKSKKVVPLILFHSSRLISFFLLGGLIGLIGSAFVLNQTTTFVLNLVLFFVMLIMGLNLLNVFSWSKKLQFKLPKSLGKTVVKLEDSKTKLIPVFLGAATFVLPCGFTQSMQIYSLTTGSFLNSALIMLVFALGTFPVLSLISFASVKFSKKLESGLFFKTAGFIVIYFAIFNFILALSAIGLITSFFKV